MDGPFDWAVGTYVYNATQQVVDFFLFLCVAKCCALRAALVPQNHNKKQQSATSRVHCTWKILLFWICEEPPCIYTWWAAQKAGEKQLMYNRFVMPLLSFFFSKCLLYEMHCVRNSAPLQPWVFFKTGKLSDFNLYHGCNFIKLKNEE